jgi:hypothetical protein
MFSFLFQTNLLFKLKKFNKNEIFQIFLKYLFYKVKSTKPIEPIKMSFNTDDNPWDNEDVDFSVEQDLENMDLSKAPSEP